MKYIIYFFLISMLGSCAVSVGKVSGEYYNGAGDTLTLTHHPWNAHRNTFKMRQELDGGQIREHEGLWFYDSENKQIRFHTFISPQMDYHHTVQKENVKGKSVAKIYHSDSDNLVPINTLFLYANGNDQDPRMMGKLHGFMYSVTFEGKEHDRLQFRLGSYKDLSLDVPDTVNYSYTIRLYSEEYSYLLDNYNLKVRGNSIVPRLKAVEKEKFKFKKSKVQPNL